ncbi:anchored repeat ABC transporter, substrate-binding protein [Nocardiopsis synnemataformans]|uniref:anchored repeat ABC transporter, substrate-binding protein n=1 Tax=Nocardiopsis synnemataformans TaxID=61305 RepID=UPI003EB9C995
MREHMRAIRAAAAALALTTALAGCSGAASGADGGLTVVTTTEILADLASQVGGDLVDASSLVPPGGDPHSYEPTPADAVRVTEADVAFTNHLLLEEQALIKAIDNNIPEDALNVSLAEVSETYGANVIPLVEDLGLDVIWLGLRVRGDGEGLGATRTSTVHLRATGLDGPGDLRLYLTEALGTPVVYFDSADGFDETDSAPLPPAAHTHLNWAFDEPGEYTLDLEAFLEVEDGQAPTPVAEGSFRLAVGMEPRDVEGGDGLRVLDRGHTDLTVDLDTGEMYAYVDEEVGADQEIVPADEIVIDVPNKAVETVPDDPAFSFLGTPGEEVYQLPQAVLGRHVHGEIDPHLWQDVSNAAAYVQLIRDTLVEADPGNGETYHANADAYLAELAELDAHVTRTIEEIPEDRRQLITTHDAFGYLAEAYGMTVAGFVVPNPAQEPSPQQVAALTRTIGNLDVPAVFMEPNLARRASVLTQVAEDEGVRVCKLYGDAFDEETRSYTGMMRHNADELLRCLG